MTDENRHLSHERRLQRLEDGLENVSEKLDDIKDILTSRLSSSDVAISALEARTCPAPGSCVTLIPRIERIESRVHILEDWKNQAIGAMQGSKWTAGIVWAIFGGAISLAASKLIFAP
jgi:hypothetical protein